MFFCKLLNRELSASLSKIVSTRKNKSIVLVSRDSTRIVLHSIDHIFASFCPIALKIGSVYCRQQRHRDDDDIATTIGLGSRRRRIVSYRINRVASNHIVLQGSALQGSLTTATDRIKDDDDDGFINDNDDDVPYLLRTTYRP